MGEVYRAMHVYLKRPIALKLLKHGLANDPEMWVRFQREAELVSQLESPHVVRVEGDLPGAAAAFREALTLADAAKDFARWHGEINLRARLEARLGGVLLVQKDFAQAQTLFTAALDGWKKTGWAWGESRVLANLGTLKAQSNDFAEASRFFGEAAAAGGRCGDLLFQARALLNLARTEKRVSPGSEKPTLLMARKVAAGIGWEDGRKQAESMAIG